MAPLSFWGIASLALYLAEGAALNNKNDVVQEYPIFVPLILRHSDPLGCNQTKVSEETTIHKHNFTSSKQSLSHSDFSAADVLVNGSEFEYNPSHPRLRVYVQKLAKAGGLLSVFLKGELGDATPSLVCTA